MDIYLTYSELHTLNYKTNFNFNLYFVELLADIKCILQVFGLKFGESP